MKCFCSDLTFGGLMFWNAWSIKWKKVDPDGLDETKYCVKWEGYFILSTFVGVLSDLSVIILNAVIAIIFAKLSKFKKRHTTILE